MNSSPKIKLLPAIVRAHIVEAKQQQESVQAEITPALGAGASVRHEGKSQQDQNWPPIILIINAETTADEFATLRFGTYIVEWKLPTKFGKILGDDICWDSGFFIGESLSKSEREFMKDYCKKHGITCMTRREWLDKIFFPYGYYGYGAVVGFNLPHVLSSLATRASMIGLSLPQKPDKDGNVVFRCKRCKQRRKFIVQKEADGSLGSSCCVCHQKAKFKLEQREDGMISVILEGKYIYAGGWKLVFNEYEHKQKKGKWLERAWRPPVLIKPINPRAAMYRWGTFEGWKEKTERFYSGHFLDLHTLGLALSKDDEKNRRKNDTLRGFGERFGAKVLAADSNDRAPALTETALDDAIHNAEAILSLYHTEMAEYQKHGLGASPDHIYSGASLGKQYFQKMGMSAPPFLDTSKLPYSADEVMGFAMSAYYPGRSEARIVKINVPITYVDFHSMYPAVCINQGLWDLMRAEKVLVTDATKGTIAFMKNIKRDDLFRPEIWKRLNILCLVDPQDDMFPVRADFRPRKKPNDKISHRIALAEVCSAKEPMWYTLADCLVSYLMTGHVPRVLRALKFSPKGNKPLQPVSIRGGITIDPNHDDFFRTLVETRDSLAKTDPKLADGLKIAVNAASYGIWGELDFEEGARPVTAFSTEKRQAEIPHGEKPGRYYFPPFAALITAGARLMLYLLESEIALHGGVSAFCDTDSSAIVSSEKGGVIHERDHQSRLIEIPVLKYSVVDDVLKKFESLNPYRSGKRLIKLEKENFEDNDPSKPRVNLHASVIASKRYSLFIPAEVSGGLPKIVKPSYHTLGIVEPPRDAEGHPVLNWIDQMWQHSVAGLPFNPPWADQPVEFHVQVSRPEIRRSFRNLRTKANIKTGNKWMETYLKSVKPFNTVAVLQKSQDKFSMTKLESDGLKGIPVISPIEFKADSDARHWIAKASGRRVHILPPDRIIDRPQGMSDEDFEQLIGAHRKERQQIIKEIERKGGLFTTYMTFAELISVYQGHYESKAIDSYGVEADRDTRDFLFHPFVKITDLLFTGKESVLQEEIQTGIVSAEEADTQRIMIPPERDAMAEQVMEVLRLLSKAELKQMKIGWRLADRIQNGDGEIRLKKPELESELIKYLQEHYPEEVGDGDSEDALRAFIDNRKHLLEQWNSIKPRLSNLSTKGLAEITSCSKRESIRIKNGKVEPRIEVIKQIVVAFASDRYNPTGA
jgi:hypothetical protein